MSPTLSEAVRQAKTAEWRFEDYLMFARRHWMTIALCSLLGWGAAAWWVSTIPNSYQTHTRVLIDRYGGEPIGFGETAPLAAARRDVEFLATEYQLITSRPVLDQVVHTLNLSGFPPFSRSSDPVTVLDDMVRVAPVRGTKLADLVVTSTNPTLAMRIANTVAEVYVRLNLERRQQQATGGAQWLRDEVTRTETQMKQAQEALQRFKEEHQMVSLEDRQNVIVQRLQELSSAATEAKTIRLKADAERAEVDRALAAGSPVESLPVVRQNARVLALEQQIAAKESELADRQKVYGEKHPAITQLQAELELLRQQRHDEASKIVEGARLESETAQAKARELQQALGEQEQLALELNRLKLGYENLNRQAQLSGDMYNSLSKRLKELEVVQSMQSNNVQIVNDAKLPDHPVAPHRVRIVLQGLFVGVALGVGLAFVRELMTTTIRMRRDLEELVNLPFLGHVVRVPGARSRGRQALFFAKQPDGLAAESLRAVRTTLEFLLPERPTQRVLITSSLPQEGKTTVSSNLAVSLQELGRRVVIIDADMRRPALYRAFQIPIEPGLSTYLQGQATFEEILQTPADAQGVTVISSGATPARPADLLASPQMVQLLERLGASFQYILVDTPPVLAVADATVLSRVVDSAILIVRANRTTRETLSGTHRVLSQSPLKFLATILNDVRPEYEYHYYRRGYGYYAKRPSAPSAAPPPGPSRG